MTLPDIHLSLADRREFARMYASKIPISVIADRLQRHHSTIYREIKWNWVHDEEPLYRGYSSVATACKLGPGGSARQHVCALGEKYRVSSTPDGPSFSKDETGQDE